MRALNDIVEFIKIHREQFEKEANNNNIGKIHGVSKTYQETYEITGDNGILVYNLDTNQLIAVKSLVKL